MVWGSAAGNVISWSDTQVVASVASGAVSGVARIQQNGVWSNPVGFTVPGGGNTLTPAMLNMTVGDTHTIRAVNASGQSVTGLAWSSSNPAVVSLSADDPPVLTALAAGHVTIKAGTGSADVIVSAGVPPVGSTLWSNPTPWATVTKILPAVPSATGVADVFALNYNDGSGDSNLGIAAITSDGATAWTANLSNSCPNCAYPSPPAVPDFQGGLLAVVWNSNTKDYLKIVKLDGLTGQAHTIYSSPAGDVSLDAPVPHPDGTAFFHQVFCYHDNTWPTCGDWVEGIDSATGAQKFSIPLGLEGPGGGRGADFGSLIVAGDGYAYALYVAYEYTGAQVYVAHLMVLRIGADGTHSNMEVKSWTHPYGTHGFSGGLISDADQGVVVTWDVVEWDSFFNQAPDTHYLGMARVSGSGATVVNDNGPLVSGQRLESGPGTANPVLPVLQAQDGSFVGRVFTDAWAMVSFDATGAVRWVVPNDQPAIATEDGGVIAQSGVVYDQNGSATGQIGPMPVYSWFGNLYQKGSVDQVVGVLQDLANTFWAFQGGNASGNHAANRPLASTVQQLVAQKALSYVGSRNWVGQGVSCNVFVKQVLQDAGQAVPYSTNWVRRVAHFFGLLKSPLYYPALAGDWASRTTALGCWHNVRYTGTPRLGPDPLPADLARPGDIIAEAINYEDATGHVGVVVGSKQTASADSAAACMSLGTLPAEIIDITDYGFRPDGSLQTNPNGTVCSTHGWKSLAVVKRFACQ